MISRESWKTISVILTMQGNFNESSNNTGKLRDIHIKIEKVKNTNNLIKTTSLNFFLQKTKPIFGKEKK